MTSSPNQPDLMTAIFSAVCGHCPKCGKGKLFFSYLKTVDACAQCGEPLGHIRADDGPPWLTILIVGHIVLPLGFSTGVNSDMPIWALTLLWASIAFALMLLILPRAKGVFIGALWKMQKSPK